ncbi:acyl-CoA carboxylase subunit epsilon [Streptomyces sp. NPDC003011]
MTATVSVFDGPLGPALFKVVSGSPSAEELAAVTAVLTALAARTVPAPRPARADAGWRRPHRFPPVSWRASEQSVGS